MRCREVRGGTCPEMWATAEMSAAATEMTAATATEMTATAATEMTAAAATEMTAATATMRRGDRHWYKAKG